LIVYLLTQNYLKEEYQQTAYTCNVYVALGNLAARLSYQTRDAIISSSKVKVEFYFLKLAIKTRGKKKADDTAKAKIPRKRVASGTASKKGKEKATFDSDEGDLSSSDEDDAVIPDYPEPFEPDDMYASDSIDEGDDWETFPAQEEPPPKRRRKSDGFTMVKEGDHEVMVLSSD
jgi:ATP-dependent DNA helicase Q1